MSYLQSELSGMKLRNHLYSSYRSGASFWDIGDIDSAFSLYWGRLAEPVTTFSDYREDIEKELTSIISLMKADPKIDLPGTSSRRAWVSER